MSEGLERYRDEFVSWTQAVANSASRLPELDATECCLEMLRIGDVLRRNTRYFFDDHPGARACRRRLYGGPNR